MGRYYDGDYRKRLLPVTNVFKVIVRNSVRRQGTQDRAEKELDPSLFRGSNATQQVLASVLLLVEAAKHA